MSVKVSVIIPTYGGADYLGEAVQSVLDQSYPHFELIIVDDVSPDHTAEVVEQFTDPRVSYIVHTENKGAVAARKTGVEASSGEIIAFLDQDDLFHPEKLQTHVTYLEQHTEVGVTYNARFEYELESKSIRAIWQPPQAVTLADLVLGFPFTPSDTVLRREMALQEAIWDQSYVLSADEMIFNGAEIILGGRLALFGCKFGNVGRVLNYRRFHPRRKYKNIPGRCKAEITCQSMILDDPRCPEEVKRLRNEAYLNTNLIWAYYAFSQDDTEIGQQYIRESVNLKPSILNGDPCELVDFLATNCSDDGSVDFETHLHKILSQLPSEISIPSVQINQVLAQGYLIKGTQAVLWNRPVLGNQYLDRARELNAKFDERIIQNLTHQLLGYKEEYGEDAAQEAIDSLSSAIDSVGQSNRGQRLRGSYLVNQAFESYRANKYNQVPGLVMQALADDPKYLLNRGVMSILFRSTAATRLKKPS